MGNPTDGYGGSVISCALEQRATASLERGGVTTAVIGGEALALRERRDFELRRNKFDCVRAVLGYLRQQELGATIHVSTSIPEHAGLAGSTAILTALVAAVREWCGQRRLERHLLAEVVRTIELNYLRIQCGYQDQYMTVFGGLRYLDFRDKGQYRELRDEVFATVEDLGTCCGELPFLVATASQPRVSGHVLKPVRQRWDEGDREVRDGYRRIAELARRGKRSLIERDWTTMARLMKENHRIQQRVGASSEIDDRFVALAERRGALAAKLAGAAGGGTIIALVPEEGRDGVERELSQALREAGAVRIMRPRPEAGVRVEAVGEEATG